MHSRGMSLLEMLCVLSILSVLYCVSITLANRYKQGAIVITSQAYIEEALAFARNAAAVRGERLRLTLVLEPKTIALRLYNLLNGSLLREWSWPRQNLTISWAGLGNLNGPQFHTKPYVWNSNGRYRLCTETGPCFTLLLSKQGRVRKLKTVMPDDF